ncbi:reverse transcriptase (RNA-dependent DNA polymerase) domain-containing protein [Phthorimaea operculella]|nr:reverse transcriptase (RNA-dependent DNA polymerase) domain-containing protein [Phthorimaea operculella]
MEPSNYRPISLTSVICKAMEKIIVGHIRHFLAEHEIISDQQHGFCPHRSTVSYLLLCLSSWTSKFNNREPVDVVYLDYEKAFDKVPTTRLLMKLNHIGIRGKLLQWIEAFLRERTFRVRVGDTLSCQRKIDSGVPQGSVLGPVLYIIYTFDLPGTMKCNVSIFADDTKIFANPLVDYAKLQSDLDTTANWSKEWLINLNAEKCTVLHIGTQILVFHTN